MTEPQDQPETPTPLSLTQEVLGWLFSIFGSPAELLEKAWVSVDTHAHCSGWLRGLEALVRRLIFVEAANYLTDQPHAPRSQPRVARAAAPPDTAPSDTPRDPLLGGRFCAAVRSHASRRARARTRAAQRVQSAVRDAAPLARRLEAIRRVLNDPSRLARRWARRLAANAQQMQRLLRIPKLPREWIVCGTLDTFAQDIDAAYHKFAVARCAADTS
ncbi:MAG: hypothetical protein GC189_03455 [Alphaproteobacteria bacterium]|nr:hypothetical protein [Alphaproteobacteria bacterium]